MRPRQTNCARPAPASTAPAARCNRAGPTNNAGLRGLSRLALALAVGTGALGGHATEQQRCIAAEVKLWGDGAHDDTVALNAWFAGRGAYWAASGEPVGTTITGHSFRLSSALYVSGGTGRALVDFRMIWPERGEIVTGGTIRSGADPEQAPIVSGVTITGGDAGEGTPFETPDPDPADPAQASCATS